MPKIIANFNNYYAEIQSEAKSVFFLLWHWILSCRLLFDRLDQRKVNKFTPPSQVQTYQLTHRGRHSLEDTMRFYTHLNPGSVAVSIHIRLKVNYMRCTEWTGDSRLIVNVVLDQLHSKCTCVWFAWHADFSVFSYLLVQAIFFFRFLAVFGQANTVCVSVYPILSLIYIHRRRTLWGLLCDLK